MTLRTWLRKLPFERFRNPSARVAVVRLEGAILAAMSRFRRGTLNLEALEQTLDRAFAIPDIAAVAFAVNSPGGSAVQSALIAGRIRALADEKNVPVLAFVEDVAASGGYWLACSGDEIHADRSSIIGSIGVISSSFGFADLIARHGIERRIHTVGEHKATLDPFRPENPGDVARLKTAQLEIHEAFKDWVRSRRGDRLTGSPDEIFSGAFWTGRKARELGLIDDIGDMHGVLRARYGEKVRLIKVGGRRSLLSVFRRGGVGQVGMAGEIAETIVDGGFQVVDERALWSRFGL